MAFEKQFQRTPEIDRALAVLYDTAVSVCMGDLEIGILESNMHAAIARAMEAGIMGNARVGAGVALFEYAGRHWIAGLPPEAFEMLEDFDAGIPVKETGFILQDIRPIDLTP